MKFDLQSIKVYSNEHGYFTRLSKKDFNDEWINAFLYVQFKKGISVPDKTKINLLDSWLTFYKNKEDKTVLYLFVNDFEIIEN